ncbi:MAG: type II toxin-antitoxin system RelE/ParE family toxin [Aeromonas sp.]
MTRVFKTPDFKSWADKEDVSDAALIEAVEQMNKGLIDASLGGSVVKKRVARQGQGKSGSYRTLIAFRTADRAFYMFGFAKNERDNITKEETLALRKLAKALFGLTAPELDKAVKDRRLFEISGVTS